MKYREIELKQGNSFTNELAVYIIHKCDTQRKEDNLINRIKKILNYSTSQFYIEAVTDDCILVRNFKEFTFDDNGVACLKQTYNMLGLLKNVKIYVNVHTDDWFVVDGKEYNDDCVKWDEFIGKLEY